MKKRIIKVVAIFLLFLLTGCVRPENLVDSSNKDNDKKELEQYSADEKIMFPHFSVQLISAHMDEKDKHVLLTLRVKNDDVPENEATSETLFSVTAKQNDKELTLVKVNKNKQAIFSNNEIEYKFLLRSPKEKVRFAFTTEYKEKMTKHHEVFLE